MQVQTKCIPILRLRAGNCSTGVGRGEKGGWGDPNGKLDEHGEDTPTLQIC